MPVSLLTLLGVVWGHMGAELPPPLEPPLRLGHPGLTYRFYF